MTNIKPDHFDLFADKMRKAGLPAGVIESFKYYYYQLLNGNTGYIFENEIAPVPTGSLPQSENLSEFGAIGRENLPHTIHIVLNGGLGTSMGLLGPKSLLRVKNGMSFMQIILCRAQQQGLKLAFMNSFNTETQTVKALQKLKPAIKPFHFLQNRFPKVCQSDLKPIRYHHNPELEWNPPGHGDIYGSLYASGVLNELLAKGIKYAFISNADNLRASVDDNILGYFVSNKLPFMMEVARKTVSDVKGGHLAQSAKSGGLVLRELGQCPPENQADFFDLKKYPLFNTNNIWLDLEFFYDYISRRAFIPLPMILNNKTVDYRNADSPKVYQIESAMGAAINIFENAAAIHVPRSRLLAVKTCNDLLAVRSNCYKISANNEIYMEPERLLNIGDSQPEINLDSRYFGKIDEFEKRFVEIPDLLNCKSFTVKGDFYFEANVAVHGDVALINTTAEQVSIKSGTVLKGELTF